MSFRLVGMEGRGGSLADEITSTHVDWALRHIVVGSISPWCCGLVAIFSSGISSLGFVCFEVRGVACETILGEGSQE